jgi:hypothetical protein
LDAGVNLGGYSYTRTKFWCISTQVSTQGIDVLKRTDILGSLSLEQLIHDAVTCRLVQVAI